MQHCLFRMQALPLPINGMTHWAELRSPPQDYRRVYAVLATDALGCEIRDTVTIDSLGERPTLIMSSDSVSCFGYSDGMAMVQSLEVFFLLQFSGATH